MPNNKTVLVVGALGRVGFTLTSILLSKPGVQVRCIVRKSQQTAASSDDERQKKIQSLESRGVSMYFADVANEEDEHTLRKAVSGCDVVVSTIMNGERSIIDGQVRLLRIMQEEGVKRFIPSDYSFNLETVDVDDSHHTGMRIRFNREHLAKQDKVQWISVLCGVFPELYFHVFDYDKLEAPYWGSPDVPMDWTTIEDTAKFTAEVALDDIAFENPNRYIQIAGDVASIRQMAEYLEKAHGKEFNLVSRGSLEELQQRIETAKQQDPQNTGAYHVDQVTLCLFSGKAKLTRNERNMYPHLKFTTVSEVAKQFPPSKK